MRTPMRTRIIAVLNQKGGVGKTTTCVNLGAALARRGYRVLLIDMDPQANMTVHMGADFRRVQKSTYSLLLGEHPLAPTVLTTADPNLRYVPATLALANAEIQLASAVGRELLLREAIEVWLEDETAGEPSPRAEFVFIDCPPSLGILTMNALCAANEVLLPIQAEFFALQGVAGILESLKAVQRLNRGLQLTMVVPCMVDKRKTLAREVMEEVDRYFGKLVTRNRIRNNVKLAEAPSHGLTIFQYDAASNGAKDYDALASEVLGELPPDEPAAPPAAAMSADAPAAVEAAAPAPEPPVRLAPVADVSAAAEPLPEAILDRFEAPYVAPAEPASGTVPVDLPVPVSRLPEAVLPPAVTPPVPGCPACDTSTTLHEVTTDAAEPADAGATADAETTTDAPWRSVPALADPQ